MKQYKHGGEIYDKDIALDYSINVNPFGMPDSVKEALLYHMEEYVKYPDDSCYELRRQIATANSNRGEGVLTSEMVLCGNGAADVIYRLCLAVTPTKAMVLAPTFSEYEQALRMVKSEVVYYELQKQNGFSVDEGILRRIKAEFGDYGMGKEQGSSLLFLCNPNNPVGNLIAPEVMEKILILCRELGVLVVVDECFMEFTSYQATHSVVPKLAAFSNLIVIKAFTKTYAMAGLRLGYALSADASLLALMKASGPPWAVSTPAQVAGIAALGEDAYVAGAREYIARERSFLAGELARVGFKVYESQTNYLLFEEPEGAYQADANYISLYEAMLSEKILLRQCGNYHGLGENYYRITVGLHEDNMTLLETMRRVCDTRYK